MADILRDGGAGPELRFLGERGGHAFYIVSALTGGLCVAMGPRGSYGLAVLACPHGSAAAPFPSLEEPLLGVSGVDYEPTSGGIQYFTLEGFAADGIARVGLIGDDGILYDAAVVQNIYYRKLGTAVSARALVAYDRSGAVVYRRELGGVNTVARG